MIDLNEIKELSKIKSKKENIVTLYLNTNVKEFTSKDQIPIRLKDQTAKLRELGFKDEAKTIERQFDLVDLNRTKLLVIITSKPNKILKVLKFNVPMKTQVHVGNKVFVPPLLRIIDEYERFLVAMVDKEKMRLYTIYLGEIEEYEEGGLEYFPGHHGQGGWSQARFQRHVENQAKKTIKKAAKDVYKIFKRKKFDRIIIGGSPEIIAEFEKVLHNDVKGKVAGKLSGEMFLSDDEILKRSLEIEEKIEREKEREMVKKLENNLGYENRAVRGLDKVLREFAKGKVMQLLIESTFSETGKKCKKCGHLSLTVNSCDYCGGDTEYVDDIVAELAFEAIHRGVVVEYVRNSEGMRRNKNIGAFLRF